MAATVAAALKKIAVAVLTNPDALKKIGIVVLTAVVVILLPVAVLLGVFSGEFNIDTDRLQELVEENLSEEETARLQTLESRMTAVSDGMTAAGFDVSQAKAAQILTVMALYEYSGDGDFVSRLVGCFAADQTDAQLIANVNAAFGSDIRTQDFTNVMQNIRANTLTTGGFTDSTTKNNLDLVAWAQNALSQGWGYVWGTYGEVLDSASFQFRLNQYPYEVGRFSDFIRQNWLGKRTADCIGLIKGYGWYNPETGAIEYGSNGFPDIDATSIYYEATEKGPISTIPEIPGLAVWQRGHIGVYVGGGQVIQAAGTMQGVKLSHLSQTGFTHWLKIPYIHYLERKNDDGS